MLVQALAKGDRDELAIQAATELGVAAVVPWQANRSIVRWTGAKIERGRERWASIVREASKQSIRAHVPRVYSLVSTMQLAAFAEEWDLFVLDPHARERLTVVDLPSPQVGRPLALIVGPEGGVSDSEMALLAEAGARCVCLGEEVLRTSTAGPAAIAVLNAKLGRW
jgi:16S rRNA (uracil1498-N3)-methyltransferase